MKLLASLSIISLFALSSVAHATDANSTKQNAAKKHNVIYMIGDGMGTAYTSAYRYYKASEKALVTGLEQKIESTLFDKYLVGLASTYPADTTLVTDSAAGATALATGFKSFNGAIAMTKQHMAPLTLIERAKQQGWNTGMISTSQINHATPASFIAHIDSRRKYNEIADQYVYPIKNDKGEFVEKVDLMLGGGTTYFRRDDADVIAKFANKGWSVADSFEAMDSINELPVFGLFAPVGLPFAIDSGGPGRLKHMTEKALDLFSNQEEGFFLMVEGSQIDWCGHANDIACAMNEMKDFEMAIASAIDFAKKDGNTTVVITADHSTGGLTLAQGKDYSWFAHKVHKVHASGEFMAKQMLETENVRKVWDKYVELEISSEEIHALQIAAESANVRKLQSAINKLVAVKTQTGWTTSGHTAEDVPVIAFGPYRNDFAGFQDNTDIAKKLFKILAIHN